jgi:hypothetical protein
MIDLCLEGYQLLPEILPGNAYSSSACRDPRIWLMAIVVVDT